MRTTWAWMLLLTAASLAAAETFVPARLDQGRTPSQPVMALAGGEVLLEVLVGADGGVGEITVLRATPPFTDEVTRAVRAWRFTPAKQDDAPTPSRVLVAGTFLPPALYRAAMPGEPPGDAASPPEDLPFPLTVVPPVYPPAALVDGVVLLEVEIDEQGSVRDSRIVVSGPGFDDAARDAASLWSFRPARIMGKPAASRAYLIFGFRQPVTSQPPR